MIEQRSDEWYAQRAGKFTASAFLDLMARTKSGPSASRTNLIARLVCERLTGKAAKSYSNEAMQRGIELEPQARDAYVFEIGAHVEQVAFIDHPTVAMCGCSPDGLIAGDGLVEFKCPGAAAHLDYIRTGSHAEQYRWQLQGQLWVTGRKWVEAVSFHPEFPANMQLAMVRVSRDELAIAELERAVIAGNAEIAAIIEELNGMRKAA